MSLRSLTRSLDSISTLAKFEADVFGSLVAADGNPLTRSQRRRSVRGGSYSKLQFGSSRNTRFAAYAIQQDEGSASVAAIWDVGAFAYSPLEVSTRAMIPNRGEAQFEGDTIAVQAGSTATGETTLYSGDIELRVRFGTGRVLGLITNLRDENNSLWTYDGTAIESIRLPIGAMGDRRCDIHRERQQRPAVRFRNTELRRSRGSSWVTIRTRRMRFSERGRSRKSQASRARSAVRSAPSTPGPEPRRERRANPRPAGSRAETSIDFTLDADGDVTLGQLRGHRALARLYSRSTSILRDRPTRIRTISCRPRTSRPTSHSS